jgi:hypothetical protein
MAKVDRVADWDKFSAEMRAYIESFTVKKYGGDTKDDDDVDFDLMYITEPRIALWNVFKYVWRCWRKKGKMHDLFKMVHYTQIAYTQCKGDLTKVGITNSKGD